MSIYKSQLKRPLLLVEASVFGIALATVGDITHFTWWAVLAYVASTLVEAMYPNFPETHQFNTMVTVVSVFVTMSVPALSLIECSLFAEALRDNGVTVYSVGNWLLHYWPSARMLYRTPPRTGLKSYDAARLFALYCATQEPQRVYGCPTTLTQPVVLSAGIALLFLIEWVLF